MDAVLQVGNIRKTDIRTTTKKRSYRKIGAWLCNHMGYITTEGTADS